MQAELTPGEAAWGPWESPISNWDDALAWIKEVSERAADRTVVWRGMVNASWSLHSSLRRRVFELTQEDPDEQTLQRYEREILRRCRAEWRYDNLTTLEIFAHLQHFGGPTRLIDVSLNPLIALWFSVEAKFYDNGTPQKPTDGRLFAFTVKNRVTLTQQNGFDWGGTNLPWDGKDATNGGWGGSNSPPVLWIPPAYNPRISAQNAGFLIGGTPAGSGNWTRRPGTTKRVEVKKIRSASSLYIRPLGSSARNNRPQVKSFPMFNARLAVAAKDEIRETLERRYGFSNSTIYPDLYAVAQEVLKERL